MTRYFPYFSTLIDPQSTFLVDFWSKPTLSSLRLVQGRYLSVGEEDVTRKFRIVAANYGKLLCLISYKLGVD